MNGEVKFFVKIQFFIFFYLIFFFWGGVSGWGTGYRVDVNGEVKFL